MAVTACSAAAMAASAFPFAPAQPEASVIAAAATTHERNLVMLITSVLDVKPTTTVLRDRQQV